MILGIANKTPKKILSNVGEIQVRKKLLYTGGYACIIRQKLMDPVEKEGAFCYFVYFPEKRTHGCILSLLLRGCSLITQVGVLGLF